jgi:DHA2 family multidrug resistance protein
LMTMMFIPNPKYIERSKGALDWIGLSLMTAGLSSLQYVLERGEHDDWYDSSTITILTIVAVVTLALFVWRMLRERRPLVNLKVFRHSSFTIGNVLGIISGFGLFGTALILPLFFQTILGFTAFDTGLMLLPGALSTAVSMMIVGRMLNRIDGRASIAFGFLVFGLSTWMLGGLTTDAGFWDVFWPRLIQGFGLGFLFVPLSTITLGDIPIAEMAGATGVYTLVRQLGGSLGIAILTTLLVHQTAVAWNVLASGVTQTHGYSVGTLTAMVAQQSSMIAYNYLFRVTAIVFALAAPLAFLMKVKPRTASAPASAALAAAVD